MTVMPSFWTLVCFTVAAEFVEAATKTSSVRDASGRTSIKIGTAPHRHSRIPALSG